ncbi:DNA-J related domain-containing protein [Candidatus Riflebacteria bacterium]
MLEDIILELLRNSPAGIAEFELLQLLAKRTERKIFCQAFTNNHKMFRAHFLLFHLLYRLRDSLWLERKNHLEISPVNIILSPYREAAEGLDIPDPLREYYLDLSYLKSTTAEDVDEMLDLFWTHNFSLEYRKEALSTLGLEDPVSDETIQKQYRRAVKEYHPDLGGDEKKLQAINAAMAVIKGKRRKL